MLKIYKNIRGIFKEILTGSLAVVCCGIAHSSDQTSEPDYSPTLTQMYELALIRSPEIAAHKITQRINSAELAAVDEQRLPSVSLTASKGYSHSAGSFPSTAVDNNRVSESGKIGFNITQSLYDPVFSLDKEFALLTTESDNFELEKLEDDLATKITSLFFEVLGINAEINLLNQQLIAVDEQQAQARLSFEVGTVSITDVREAEAKYDNLIAQLSALKWQLKAKNTELLLLSGVTINPKDYNAGTRALPEVSEEDLNLWLSKVDEHHPRIRQAIIEFNQAEIELAKYDYSNYPTVQLSVDNNYQLAPWSDEARKTFNNNRWDWGASLQVQVPLWDPKFGSAQKLKAVASRDRAYEEIRKLQDQINNEINITFYQMLASIAQYKGLYKAEKSAETALLANRLGYQVGMRINADVLDAQAKLYQVNNDQLKNWYSTWEKYIKLNQLAGTLTTDQLDQIDSILRQNIPESSELDLSGIEETDKIRYAANPPI